ncbi:MAG: ABC transporter ATP-binding protein [Gemmatimonadota bacterium]
MTTAIRVEDLGKRYRIGSSSERHDTLSEAILSGLRSPWRRLKELRRLGRFDQGDDADVIWALRHLDFEVQEGEVLGIIGRNGAGKSTLLKVLARITDPSEGRVTIRGNSGALLEVGTGFHPELTGRDNIYLNGAILGMDRAYIDRMFDEIVDFSGVRRFVDTPVKRYSSGMKVRLAFAVAAHLQPEVLIIDEVLSVGDAEFQERCLNKMEDVARGGRTVLFVSHNMHAVRSLCTRCLWIDEGRVRLDTSPREAVESYLRAFRDVEVTGRVDLGDWPNRYGRGGAKILRAELFDPAGELSGEMVRGRPLRLEFDVDVGHEGPVNLTAIVTSDTGDRVLNLAHFDSPEPIPRSLEGTHRIRLEIDSLPLFAGEYSFRLGVLTEQMDPLDVVVDAVPFSVRDDPDSPRPFRTDSDWGYCWTPNRWRVVDR